MEAHPDAYGAQIILHVCSWTPTSVSLVHKETAKSCMMDNASLLSLTGDAKQPLSLWASPKMCAEHPWSYPHTQVWTLSPYMPGYILM